MELYIKVSFWLCAVSFSLRIIGLAYAKYPREVTRNTDTLAVLIATPFLVWLSFLYFNIP